MKIVLYSGGHEVENLHLHREAVKLTGKKKPRITYIPACSYDSERDFLDYVSSFSPLNIYQFIYLPIDRPAGNVLIREAFNNDIIFLSGGNTYYFLKHLRRNGFLPLLKKFVERGGVLSGLSAGAILMCPTIRSAGYPHFDCDENEDNIRNFRALNLLKFEFFPHYRNSSRYDNVLKEESLKVKTPIYALPDYHGMVIDGAQTTFFGRAYAFYEGKKMVIS